MKALLVRLGDWFFGYKQELPSFTVNLDDTEARWNAEAKDEWDIAFRGAVGWLPAFSRLEAERLKGASPAVLESEELRRELLRQPGDVIRFSPARRIGPIDAPWNLMAAPNPFVAAPGDIERYNDLLRAKGIDPDAPLFPGWRE